MGDAEHTCSGALVNILTFVLNVFNRVAVGVAFVNIIICVTLHREIFRRFFKFDGIAGSM